MDFQIDNPNDRKLLILLTYAPQLTCKQSRLYGKLSNIYTDNETHLDVLRDELVSLKFLDLSRGEKSEAGAYDKRDNQYSTTYIGIKAITSGKFPSEIKERKIQRRNLYIGWGAALIGAIGGIVGLCAAAGFF